MENCGDYPPIGWNFGNARLDGGKCCIQGCVFRAGASTEANVASTETTLASTEANAAFRVEGLWRRV